jgi:hypothetical protein
VLDNDNEIENDKENSNHMLNSNDYQDPTEETPNQGPNSSIALELQLIDSIISDHSQTENEIENESQ